LNFASNRLANAWLYASFKTVDPDKLITLILEESEQNIVHCLHQGGKPSKGEDKGKAMMALAGKHTRKRLAGTAARRGTSNISARSP